MVTTASRHFRTFTSRFSAHREEWEAYLDPTAD